jgi:hypothetical protein
VGFKSSTGVDQLNKKLGLTILSRKNQQKNGFDPTVKRSGQLNNRLEFTIKKWE